MDAPGPLATLLDAIRSRNADAVAACFAEDYRNETPAHPARGFTGREQVRRNWSQILAAVPDLEASVSRMVQDGATVWTEWAQIGTRADGAAFEMVGVVVFELDGDLIGAARFYLEPVDRAANGIDAAVRGQLGSGP